MSYLQVVGEQHQQVEGHMAAFTSRVVELRAKHNLLLPGSVEVCEAPLLCHTNLVRALRTSCRLCQRWVGVP